MCWSLVCAARTQLEVINCEGGCYRTALALRWTLRCWDCFGISKFFQRVQVGVSQFAEVCFSFLPFSHPPSSYAATSTFTNTFLKFFISSFLSCLMTFLEVGLVLLLGFDRCCLGRDFLSQTDQTRPQTETLHDEGVRNCWFLLDLFSVLHLTASLLVKILFFVRGNRWIITILSFTTRHD